jgi:exosome complex RNA-binding protein Rrp4
MAFTEKQSYRIEINEDLSIGVRRSDIVLKDDVEVGRTYHRSLFQPGDDVSGEVQEVQAVAAAVWSS